VAKTLPSNLATRRAAGAKTKHPDGVVAGGGRRCEGRKKRKSARELSKDALFTSFAFFLVSLMSRGWGRGRKAR
jgi:hypothetical protein